MYGGQDSFSFHGTIITCSICHPTPSNSYIVHHRPEAWDCVYCGVASPASSPRNVYATPNSVMDLVAKGRHRALALSGMDLQSVYLPFSQEEFKHLMMTAVSTQIAFADFLGNIIHNPPRDPRLSFLTGLRYVLRTALSLLPLPSALTVFTDGTKSRGVVVWEEEGEWKSLYTTEQSSAQRAELAAVILAFQQFANIPFNLIVDSQYVYNLLNVLPLSYITPAIDQNLFTLFSTLQNLVQARTCQFYVAYLRSHTGYPGYLAEANAQADHALKNGIFSLFSDPFESHSVFHQNAKVLAKSFSLPISQARDIGLFLDCGFYMPIIEP